MMDCKHANRRMTFVTMDGQTIKSYSCKHCGESLPTETNDFDIATIRSIALGSGTAPTRRPGAETVEAREKRWAKDMPAYKELRKQGMQPPKIDGSAELAAKAETRFEVESGQILQGESKRIETAVKALESATGTSIYTPNTTPVNL